ncbi:methyl-accepting chemotaxis protein [Vibrio sp. T187]|uniref:methyl-accepting chemotaxis protein n=1 Tax=Vibrio TaxID=662 RepID=UPI0010C9FE5A|nr:MULTISPECIES: methyl-accepting chemotaxis protein [Vibrio]MBW3697824.1 methyl-accepting chemotaxis protein [Vibrio sp. T187]
MTNLKRPRNSLSLIQMISVIFVSIILLVVILSFTSVRGVERVGKHFETLSEQALPLAMHNADLTQSILEQVKLLSYGTQTEDMTSLSDIQQSITAINEHSNSVIQSLFLIADNFSAAVSKEQQLALKDDIEQLQSLSLEILNTQMSILHRQERINSDVTEFRYGLSSIGPEMNRISSFLVQNNPEAYDAANRFTASASSMESTFLVLMMQENLASAEREYKEMRNRIAGINLAYDDFSEWHPDIKDFASLTAPYEMVQSGFETQGVLKQILSKLELAEKQKQDLALLTQVADRTITTLNDVSSQASSIIGSSEQVVTSTISTIVKVILMSGLVITLVVFVSWLWLRAWTNKGLKNITQQLTQLSNHDFSGDAKQVGPYELKEIARKLNLVISATNDSLSTVTRNCETLYQTAEVSHEAAEQTNYSLVQQNDSLQSMITTITQLEASIGEIAAITNASNDDAVTAAKQSSQGSKVIGLNQARLHSLENTLNINEESMVELDSRVKEIREMVDMISGIAESTNLLALNAAIEAARAGEQGRGFAVVADEVRKLASGTSQQTTNIREMMNELVAAADKSRDAVTESRKEMSNALETSDDVKTTFEEIAQAVEKIRGRVEQIMVATEEQERATADVSRSISLVSDRGESTKYQLESMVESSQQVAQIAGNQQTMLHKYVLK